MNTCGRPFDCIGQPPTLGYQAMPPPSAYYSVETVVPRWTQPHQAPTTRAWTDCVTSALTRVKTSVKYRSLQRHIAPPWAETPPTRAPQRRDQPHLYRNPSETEWLGFGGGSRFRATQRLRSCETDPRSMDKTTDRHSSDHTRTVLTRPPPGETGESAASSSFPHQALSSEVPTTASRLWWRVRPFCVGPWSRVDRCFDTGLAPLHSGGSLHDTASKRILGVEIPRTLSRWFRPRVYHRKWMLGQILTHAAGRRSRPVVAVSTTPPPAPTRCRVNKQWTPRSWPNTRSAGGTCRDCGLAGLHRPTRKDPTSQDRSQWLQNSILEGPTRGWRPGRVDPNRKGARKTSACLVVL